MNKCYLKIYLNNNLGDDLFAKIITDRYPNTQFINVSYLKQKSNFKNIKVIKGYLFKAINKILKIFFKTSIENILAKKCPVSLSIGGSLFIEGKSGDSKELRNSSNYYIIGTNFGPYKTKEYLESCRQVFKNAQFVCFRDKKSYDLFSNLENTSYAPDIAFGLDTKNITITNNKRVIISVIDCKKKIGEQYESKYDEMIRQLIGFFINKGYKVTLMSFCKGENDEEAIKRIMQNIKNKENIDIYNYNGNIEEALNVLADSQIIVGSRFHANILGLILNKTIIPVIYSKKTSNVIEEIGFKGRIIDIKKLNEFDVNDIKESELNYKIDVSEEIKNSNKHFEKLDKILK